MRTEIDKFSGVAEEKLIKKRHGHPPPLPRAYSPARLGCWVVGGRYSRMKLFVGHNSGCDDRPGAYESKMS
jgi:hypothetical protein